MVGGNNDKWPLFKGFSWKLKRRGSLDRGQLRAEEGGRDHEADADIDRTERSESTTYTWSYSTAGVNADKLGTGVQPVSAATSSGHRIAASRCSEGIILRVPTRTAYNGAVAHHQHYQQPAYSESRVSRSDIGNANAIGEDGSGGRDGIPADTHDANGDESDDEEYYYYDDDDDADDQDAANATEATSFIDFYNNQERERQYREQQLQQRQWDYPNYYQRIHNDCAAGEVRAASTTTAPTVANTNKFTDKWRQSTEGGKHSSIQSMKSI